VFANTLPPNSGVGCLPTGTYSGFTLNGPHHIWLRPADGATVTISGAHTELRAPSVGVTIYGLRFAGVGDGEPQIQLWADDPHILHNEISNAHTANCIRLGSRFFGQADNAVIDHNYIHDCGADVQGHGISADEGKNFQITNNRVNSNTGFGIQLYKNADCGVVRNNELAFNGGSGVLFGGDSTSLAPRATCSQPRGDVAGCLVADQDDVSLNVIHDNDGFGVEFWSGCGNAPVGESAGSNCFYGGDGYDMGPFTRTGGDVFATPCPDDMGPQ
jgi:parallel beta-helix repeat protein